MHKFKSIFNSEMPIIGMIHLKALPGTPKYQHDSSYIIQEALKEADIYKTAGIDAIMIENMHDVPYLKAQVGHEISTIIAIVAHEIKQRTQLPVGIQILAGANVEAMAAAKASNVDIIRAEGFVFADVSD